MKKNWLYLPYNREVIKLLRKMKITVFFLIVTVLGSLAAESYSQSTKLTLKFENSTVKEILKEIENQSEFRFFYSGSVDVERQASVSYKNTKISEILDELFDKTGVEYEVRGKQIALIKVGESFNFSDQQQKAVSGKVTDETDEPLPGVTVVIEGTSQGTITDIDGNYSVPEVPAGATLVFSFVGMTTQKILVGNRSNIDIVLKTDAIGVEEVVVTALGITKKKKALGYSVQEIGSAQLDMAQAPDLGSKLSGKVAGMQVNTSSTIGGSSRIVLRGESSLSRGGNEAMIVVDGVPINTESSVASGIDWGNGLSDLNSNDIESVSVLKGAAAAALYGSRAGNGVILITTKKGTKGKSFKVDYNGSLMFESLLSYPDTYQYEFAIGKYGDRGLYTGRGEFNPAPYDEAWSSERYDPSKYIEWWYSPTWNGSRAGDIDIQNKGRIQKLPFESTGKNNYEEFFEVGRTYYNQVAISSSSDNMDSRISFENMDQTGMQPGTDLKRNSISSNVTMRLDKKVRLNLTTNYINTKSDNRPEKAWNGTSVYYVMAWMMPGANMNQMQKYWQPGLEGQKTINWRTGYNNPYFIAHEIKNSMDKNRLFGNVNLDYSITKNVSLMLRHGEDLSFRKTNSRRPFGAISKPAFSESRNNVREANSDFLLSYKSNRGSNWNYDINFGGNRRFFSSESLSAGTQEMLVPNLYTFNNSAISLGASEGLYEKEVYSLYSFVNLDYKNKVYLALTGRNDWSSTLPSANNSYFYPSATLSVLMNEIISLPEQISFLKLRAGLAEVGKDTSPYQLQNVLVNDGTYNNYLGFSLPSIVANSQLKPERSVSKEFGLSAKFLKGRIGLDATYYTQVTTDQIVSVTLPQSSGYGGRWLNTGEIQNKGFELSLNLIPVKTNSFSWNIDANFSTNKSKVVELSEGLDQYSLGGFGDNGEQIMAQVGGPVFGIIGYKQKVVEDESSQYFGEKVYSSSGAPVRKDSPEYLGKANPDWILGLNNSFRYKDFSLSFLLDIRHGGISYSGATNIMYGGGYNQATADWRNNGVGGEGVIDNGDGTYSPNDIVLSGDQIKSTWVSPWRKISTNNFFDSSFVKLRELNLSYNLPSQLTNRLPFDNMTMSLVGRNLFIWDHMPNQDPDVYRDGIPGYAGTWTYPSSRTYGFSLKVSF